MVKQMKLSVKTIIIFKVGTSSEEKEQQLARVLDLVHKEHFTIDERVEKDFYDVMILRKEEHLPSSSESTEKSQSDQTSDNPSS